MTDDAPDDADPRGASVLELWPLVLALAALAAAFFLFFRALLARRARFFSSFWYFL